MRPRPSRKSWKRRFANCFNGSGSPRGRLGAGIQRVTGGAHGADGVFGDPLDAQRLAQAPDMDVDGARLDIDIRAPDRVQQLFAAEDPARMLLEV